MGDIERIAKAFRKAVEIAIINNEKGDYFERFPYGQCGTTSDMLAQYYIDNGFKHVMYVNGIFNSGSINQGIAHTWLLIDDVIVDITGDQFKEKEYPPIKFDKTVYVGKETDFHKQFDINHGSFHEHNGLDSTWFNYYDLKKWYKIILKYIMYP